MNDNQLTLEELIGYTEENNLPELNLSEFKLTSIPDEVFHLKQLQILHLGNAPIKKISSKIANLEYLTEFTSQNAKFEVFPRELLQIKTLEHVRIAGKNLKQLPIELSQNDTIKYLNIEGCKSLSNIEHLPIKLKYLNIGNTAVQKISDCIASLQYLVKLVIHNLNFTSFPEKIFELKELLSLFIGNNKLTTFPSKIANLNLLELFAYDNLFTKFPKEVTNISNLRKLNLSRNAIESVPDEIINLKDLTELNLSDNNFTYIPNCLKDLNNLKDLSFSNLYMRRSKSQPDSILRAPLNKIEEIPPWIINLENLENFSISNNPITNVPPEILNGGIKAIKNFFYSKLEADNEEFLYEAKMVVVGRGNVGKSVLTKKLTVPGYSLTNNSSTTGIEVLKSPFVLLINHLGNIANFKLNIWDFGGQEKYDATHQLFITGRTIYLFLTEAREESNYSDFYFWLNTIRLFSKNSPVIVVLSKIDERKKLLPQSTYKEIFENIINFVDVSCSDGYEYTIQSLKNTIINAITSLPQLTQRLSNRWIDIRNELEILAKSKDYLTYFEYLHVCKKHKLDSKRADFLSQYLNDLGVIVHHQHDLLLKKTVFINPDWCVDGMYKVLDDEMVLSNRGKFNIGDLQFIWKEERFENKQEELLKLMKHYNLCFELRDGSGYIAPDLLPPDKTEKMQWEEYDNLYFEYHYDFMPAGILSRFIVKSHSFIKDNLYWKYGVILEHDNTKAIVEEEYIHGKIKIAISGENKKGLLTAIRMYINEVHLDFDKTNKLNFEEMVPCNCGECKDLEVPHFYKFNVLRRFENKSIKTTTCEKSIEPVSIRSLINDVLIDDFSKELHTNLDLKKFILQLLTNTLERDIRLKEGYLNFWRDQKCSQPKNEIEFQPYICSMIENECRVRGIHLSREVREANGSIDALFTYTNRENEVLKVCMEIKKAHHTNVEKAITTQLPTYMQSVATDAGIYLVCWFKNSDFVLPDKYNSWEDLEREIEKNNLSNRNISTKILNCTKPIPPSKKRKKAQAS